MWVSDTNAHPDAVWVEQQARNFCMHLEEHELEVTLLLPDRDAKLTAEFDGVFKTQGIVPKRLPIRSPNLNAYAERFVQTLKHECLHHFLICDRTGDLGPCATASAPSKRLCWQHFGRGGAFERRGCDHHQRERDP